MMMRWSKWQQGLHHGVAAGLFLLTIVYWTVLVVTVSRDEESKRSIRHPAPDGPLSDERHGPSPAAIDRYDRYSARLLPAARLPVHAVRQMKFSRRVGGVDRRQSGLLLDGPRKSTASKVTVPAASSPSPPVYNGSYPEAKAARKSVQPATGNAPFGGSGHVTQKRKPINTELLFSDEKPAVNLDQASPPFSLPKSTDASQKNITARSAVSADGPKCDLLTSCTACALLQHDMPTLSRIPQIIHQTSEDKFVPGQVSTQGGQNLFSGADKPTNADSRMYT